MSPAIPDHAISIELEIPFHDVDSQGVVWHGHYLKYLEIARCALLRSFDLDVPRVVELGWQLMVIDSHIRHLQPLRYGSRLRVTCWLTEIEHRLDFAYELQDMTTGRRCARAQTQCVTTDLQGHLCLQTPEPIRAKLPKLEAEPVRSTG